MTTLLIDGDVICYRAAFAAQHNMYQIQLNGEEGYIASFRYKKELTEYLEKVGLEEQDYTVNKELVVEPVQNALHSAKHMLQSMLDKFSTKNYRLFLTGKDNYRMEIASYYKANRTAPKPVHYEEMRSYLINVWNAEVVDGQEADDAMGIEQTSNIGKYPYFGKIKKETIICTNDKDLDTIEGWHYDFTKDGDKYFVDSDYAVWFFYKQLLMGDTVDNIKGIPGVGAKKAEKMLEDITREDLMYAAVLESYIKHYIAPCKTDEGVNRAAKLAKRMLLENARLLYIRKEENELWNLPV